MGALKRLWSAFTRRLDTRDVWLYGGWLLMTTALAWEAGMWGLALGGLALFTVGVFGIAPGGGS